MHHYKTAKNGVSLALPSMLQQHVFMKIPEDQTDLTVTKHQKNNQENNSKVPNTRYNSDHGQNECCKLFVHNLEEAKYLHPEQSHHKCTLQRNKKRKVIGKVQGYQKKQATG